jgi:nucleotide-binding universal stress UspA family protein
MVKIDNVLLITDFSENARHALGYARAMAERFESKLHILHVIGDPTSYIYGEAKGDFLAMEKRARIKAREEIDKYRAFVGDLPNYEMIIKEGGVLDRVLETIEEKHIDNVVMGSQGGGVLRNLLTGSIADKITRGVRCHVWIIRPQSQVRPSSL